MLSRCLRSNTRQLVPLKPVQPQVLHLIKTAPRPLELSFEDASGHSSSGSTAAADVSAETSTPRQERSSAEGSVSASPGLAVEYSSVVTGLNQADSDISDLR
eukprot:SAG31_NODE_453_length_15464_cov_37.074064_6_plen_102_part_00